MASQLQAVVAPPLRLKAMVAPMMVAQRLEAVAALSLESLSVESLSVEPQLAVGGTLLGVRWNAVAEGPQAAAEMELATASQPAVAWEESVMILLEDSPEIS